MLKKTTYVEELYSKAKGLYFARSKGQCGISQHFCGEGLGRPGLLNFNDCSYLNLWTIMGTRLAGLPIHTKAFLGGTGPVGAEVVFGAGGCGAEG